MLIDCGRSLLNWCSAKLMSLSHSVRPQPVRLNKRQTSFLSSGMGMADPVEDGLVAHLARPGGNVTGTTFLGPQLVAKRLQLLSAVVPQHSRVAILWHPRAYSDRTMTGMLKEAEHAAKTLGMNLQFVPAASPDDITNAFAMISRDRVDALCLFPTRVSKPM